MTSQDQSCLVFGKNGDFRNTANKQEKYLKCIKKSTIADSSHYAFKTIIVSGLHINILLRFCS